MRVRYPLALFPTLLVLLLGCGDSDPTYPVVGSERRYATHREIDVKWRRGEVIISGTVHLPNGAGPFPALAMHFGSGEWVRGTFAEIGVLVEAFGLAVLTYDKRGVGESGGMCCPEDFPLLAGDLEEGVRTLRRMPGIDITRIGLFGSSQGAWIVPIAAAELGDTIRFVTPSVGGIVTVGEQNLFARLTGFNDCVATGTPLNEITGQVEAAGGSGFDPRPWLARMRQPAMWLFGENDLSTPTAISVARLDSLTTVLGRDWSFVVFPGANHSLIANGTICQDAGQPVDFVTPLADWFARVLAGGMPAP